MSRIAILLAVVLAVACSASRCETYPTAPPMVVVTDAAPSACETACAALRGWGCPEGFPTLAGTCEGDCERVEGAGLDVGSACIAGAETLDAARACRTRHGQEAVRCVGR